MISVVELMQSRGDSGKQPGGHFKKEKRMETKDYLNYVVHEIHRTIMATVDDEDLSCGSGS